MCGLDEKCTDSLKICFY